MNFRKIDKRFLTIWKERELEYIESFILNKQKSSDINALIAEIFPEISDGESHSNFYFNSPITTQIPFSKKMVVDIRPYPNEKEFKKFYGINVEEFTKLVAEDYLIPQFGSDIFRYEGRDYLIPIFKESKNWSSNFRTDGIFRILDVDYSNHINATKIDLENNLLIFWAKSELDLKSYFHGDFDAFLTACSKRISRIKALSPYFGKILFSYRKRKDFLQLLNVFSSIFLFPITKSLGGVYRTSLENYYGLQKTLVKTKVKNKKIMPFATDIAEPICKSIKAKIPTNMDIISLTKYLSDDLVDEANKLMFEIEGQVQKNKIPNQKRNNELINVWNEISLMIEKNEKRKNRIKRVLNIGIAAVVGARLWKNFDFNVLIYGVVGREIFKNQSDTIVESISDKYVKLLSKTFQPNHVVLFNDYLDNVEKAVPKIYLS